MKEKKKHWWNKLKERWDSMDQIEKNFVIASVGSFISGAAIGGALCYNAATYEGHKKLIEYADDCAEMQKPLYVMCYTTGVYDGQKNPELLEKMEESGWIDNCKKVGMIQ